MSFFNQSLLVTARFPLFGQEDEPNETDIDPLKIREAAIRSIWWFLSIFWVQDATR